LWREPFSGKNGTVKPQYFDIEKRNWIIVDQLKEKTAGPAPADNGNIQ
jgi:hypothetical protein